MFVVFVRGPGGLAAAAIDAASPGLRRQTITPSGLNGWSWGILDLDAVPVQADDVLDGDGMAVLRKHFARYRPLVTATGLGSAAAVFDTVTTALANRFGVGELSRLRDSALVTVGQSHAQLVGALLATFAAAQLTQEEHRQAEPWAAAIKAYGIETAHKLTADLALLVGASGFRMDCALSKIQRDLAGLRFADGIHDSLYRAAGKRHVAAAGALDSAGQAIL